MSPCFSCLELDASSSSSCFSAAGAAESSIHFCQGLTMVSGPRATAGHLAQRKRHLGLAGLRQVVCPILSASTGLGQPEACQLWAVLGEEAVQA